MDITARTRLKLLAGFTASFVAGCGGTKTSTPPPIPPAPTPPIVPPPPTGTTVGLFRDAYVNNFLVGAAIGASQIASGSSDAKILREQFNSITAENVMKPQTIAPTEGVYNFGPADDLLAFAEANNMKLRGHALLWHQQTPAYFFEGTKAEIRARLEKYITDVVTHFKGKIYAWDVVNEMTSDSDGGTAPYRNSNWYQAVGGAEYIDWALQAARAADPDAKLFINDYNTELASKRTRYLQIIEDLIARNIPLDGIGHQCHIQASTNANDVFAAIDAVDNLFAGLKNHITELDISIYSDPGSCFASTHTNCAADVGNNAPASVLATQAQLYRSLFNGFVTRSSVTSTTVWGLTDDDSWLNSFPVSRSNYPLLYDASRAPKPAFHAITDPSFVI